MWSNRQVREWLEGSSSSSSDEEDYDVTKNVAVSELNRMKRKFLEGKGMSTRRPHHQDGLMMMMKLIVSFLFHRDASLTRELGSTP